jgi:hypothetical protein
MTKISGERSQRKFNVLPTRQILFPAPYRAKRVAPPKRASSLPRRVEPEEAIDVRVIGQHVPQNIFVSRQRLEKKSRKNDKIIFRIRLERGKPLFQTMRVEHVIRVKEENELTPRKFNSNIPATASTLRSTLTLDKQDP